MVGKENEITLQPETPPDELLARIVLVQSEGEWSRVDL